MSLQPSSVFNCKIELKKKASSQEVKFPLKFSIPCEKKLHVWFSPGAGVSVC